MEKARQRAVRHRCTWAAWLQWSRCARLRSSSFAQLRLALLWCGNSIAEGALPPGQVGLFPLVNCGNNTTRQVEHGCRPAHATHASDLLRSTRAAGLDNQTTYLPAPAEQKLLAVPALICM